ncbi:MAG: trigger factor [Burkholderiaceae bacterium]
MTQNLETLGALERRIDLTVAADEMSKEVAKRLAKLSRTVKMPGFRPGKVPMKMVEASYGPQVENEVLNDLIGNAFVTAVSEAKLRVAGAPRVEPKETAEGATEFGFTASFEVYPEITTPDLSAVEIKRAICPVGEAEIDATIDIMRKQRATYDVVERAAGDTDQVTLDFKGMLDGVAFQGGTAEGFSFVLGAGRMLPEFEEAVRGLRAGETKTFPLTFPNDYGSAELAGKTVEFTATVTKVEQAVLPPVDGEFAKSLGIVEGEVEKMRAEIRSNLEREVESRLKARTKDAAMDALVAAAQFDLPKALIAEDQQRLVEMARADMASRGMDVKNAPIPAELFASQAERRVRLGLLVGELVAKEGLTVKPDQIRKLVEDMAQSYERPQEVINWYLSDRKRVAELEAVALENNVVDWALAKAKTVDTPVAFDELMGRKQ